VTLHDFALRYTAAWCSQDPSQVAAHFTPNGSLTINDGPPSTGHPAITADALSFMTAFPDLRVAFDRLVPRPDGRVEYHWTLTGTHAATSRPVHISGFELWTLNPADGLIAISLGHFDAADYQRQLDS
jgi:hypothetical protein